MPSPLAHISVGCAAGFVLGRRRKGPSVGVIAGNVLFTGLCVLFSVLPDIDAVPGLILGDFAAHHNDYTHSLVVAVVVCAVAYGAFRGLRIRDAGRWACVSGGCYATHILMDFFGHGRGVKLLWPFFRTRFSPGVHIFHGVRWSEGWLSVQHVWTLLNEAAFVTLLALLVILLRGRTVARAHGISR